VLVAKTEEEATKAFKPYADQAGSMNALAPLPAASPTRKG
jgi:hypothetical protein